MKTGINYGSVRERFRWISSMDHPEHPALILLDRLMKHFYQQEAVDQNYHRMAESGNRTWDDHCLHRAITELVDKDDMVVEISCGSGYRAKHFTNGSCRHYIGIDLSGRELARTKKDCPFAWLAAGDAYQLPLVSSSADLVISLYSLEHIVWPKRYLDEMLRIARIRGHIAIAFPEYLRRPGGRPVGSMRFGRSPGGARYKISQHHWADAIQTFFERTLLYRILVAKWRRAIYSSNQVKFLINTNPLCLVAQYASDNDAIYFTSEEEIARYLTRNGCDIVRRSGDVVNAPEGNGLVIAKVIRK